MPVGQDILTCQAKVQNLDEVTGFVEDCADRFELDVKKKFGLLVVVEEAFVNICNHAYQGGEGLASFTCETEAEHLILEISDSGAPFDILSLPEPDITSDIMDRQVGGLGVHFIRKLSDSVSYRRENGQNILRLEFSR